MLFTRFVSGFYYCWCAFFFFFSLSFFFMNRIYCGNSPCLSSSGHKVAGLRPGCPHHRHWETLLLSVTACAPCLVGCTLSPTLSLCRGFFWTSGWGFQHQFFWDTSVPTCFLFLLLMYHSWTNTCYYFWSGARCIAWGIRLRTLVSSSSCQVIQPVASPSWWRRNCIFSFKGNYILFS